MLGLSYGMQDLIPWPGIEPRPPHWEHRVLATGPPGKSSSWLFNTPWTLVESSIEYIYVQPQTSLLTVFLFSFSVYLFVCVGP